MKRFFRGFAAFVGVLGVGPFLRYTNGCSNVGACMFRFGYRGLHKWNRVVPTFPHLKKPQQYPKPSKP